MTHTEQPPAPRPVHQVMVSSTYTDLSEHRAVLIAAGQMIPGARRLPSRGCARRTRRPCSAPAA